MIDLQQISPQKLKELQKFQSETSVKKQKLLEAIEKVKNQLKHVEKDLDNLNDDLEEMSVLVEKKTITVQSLCGHQSTVASTEFIQNLGSIINLFDLKKTK